MTEKTKPIPRVVEGKVASRSDRLWEERLETYLGDQVNRLRTVAERWSTTVGALTALFSAVLLARGTADLNGLSANNRLAVEAMLVAALALLILSISAGALAAQGVPRKSLTTGQVYRNWYVNEPGKITRWLRRSRILAGVAAALVLSAVSVVFFAHRVSIEAPGVLLINQDGVVSCHRIEKTSASGKVVLTGPVTQKDLSRARQLMLVSKCP